MDIRKLLNPLPAVDGAVSSSTMGPTRRCYLERVPCEIKLAILEGMGDAESLVALVQSSPAYYDLSKSLIHAITLKVLQNQMGVDITNLAVHLEMADDQPRHLYSYNGSKKFFWGTLASGRLGPFPRALTVRDTVRISRFYKLVDGFARQLISAPETVGRILSAGHVLARDLVNFAHVCDVRRAFYLHEHAFRLGRRIVEDDPRFFLTFDVGLFNCRRPYRRAHRRSIEMYFVAELCDGMFSVSFPTCSPLSDIKEAH